MAIKIITYLISCGVGAYLGNLIRWTFQNKKEKPEIEIKKVGDNKAKVNIECGIFEELTNAQKIADTYRYQLMQYRQYLESLKKEVEIYEKRLNVSTDIHLTTELFNCKLEKINKSLDDYEKTFKELPVKENHFWVY